MAWAHTDVTATDVANRAADKPLWCAANTLAWTSLHAGFSVTWVEPTAGADVSTATYPTKRIYDLYGHAPSKPDHAIDDYFDIYIDAGTTFHAFDMLAFVGHNFGLCGAAADGYAARVLVTLSDVANFASGYVIASWLEAAAAPSQLCGDWRLVEPVLYSTAFGGAAEPDGSGPYQWSGGRYMKVTIGSTAPHDLTALPYLSELWLGDRTQLLWHPDYPWDPRRRVSTVADAVSLSGVRTRYAYSKAGRVIEWEYVTDDTTEQASIATAWEYCEHGTAPSLLLPEPTTKPLDALIVVPNPPELIMPWEGGPYERHWRTQWTECAPFRDAEL